MTHDGQQQLMDRPPVIAAEQRREDILETERLKKELEAQAAREAEIRRQREAKEPPPAPPAPTPEKAPKDPP